MRLISVYQYTGSYQILWDLMKERDATVNISHRKMPTWEKHVSFINSKPYHAWHLLLVDGDVVGSVYLSKQNEIGVFIFKGFRGRGYGPKAIDLIMKLYPRSRYLANINPKNEKSIKLFEGLGFKLLQHTFELVPGQRDMEA